MPSSIPRSWKLLYLYLVTWKHVNSLLVTLTSSRPVLGDSVVINCSANFESWETERLLQIDNSERGVSFSWTEGENRSLNLWEKVDGRYIVTVDSPKSHLIVMSVQIPELKCLDAGSYLCTAASGWQNISRKIEVNGHLDLNVEVLPAAPTTLQVTPESGAVKENDWFDIRCSAVTEQNDKSWIQWRVFCGQVVEIVSAKDARIILEEGHNMTGDNFCCREITSKFRLSVTRSTQRCQVACFSPRLDAETTNCNNTVQDMCAITAELNVLYGVSGDSMQLHLYPDVAITDGATVNIMCHAEGNPPANYSWVRTKPHRYRNKAIPGRRVANGSLIVLENFRTERDAGTYRCTAWNWVKGIEFFSASQEVTLSPLDVGKQLQPIPPVPAFLMEYDLFYLTLIGVAIIVGIILFFIIINIIVVWFIRRRKKKKKPKSRRKRFEKERSVESSSSDLQSESGSEMS